MSKIKVKIVGGTGYTGGELIKILLNHPEAELVAITASSIESPQPLHSVWNALRGKSGLQFTKENSNDSCGADVVFLSTPHGVAMALAEDYLNQGCTVIDLSADFRFKNPGHRIGWYPEPHPPKELCEQAVYGMPELNREAIRQASLIACPGCYATSVILGLYPALKNQHIEAHKIHVSAASGVSGAGNKPKPQFHHPEMDQNYFAYRVGKHQHLPEIRSVLSNATGNDVKLSFVPHVIPVRRGILSTMFCQPAEGVTLQDLWEGYHNLYRDEPFMRVYELGEAPDLNAVANTNYLDIAVHQDQETGEFIVLSAEDNLLKGAAGQAVQCFNIRNGFQEEMGLI
jgi:N-acetyl-gamma-glutamyl-phosphate reductase